MSLSRAERFKLKSQIADEMNRADRGWDLGRINLLLSEFGFETAKAGWEGSRLAEVFATISNLDLMELYSVVTGIEQDQVQNSVESPEPGNWKRGYLRLFISHSTRHKKFIGDVSRELAVVGIHGFVAHDAMTYSEPWHDQIEKGLRSMQAFVAIVHPEFLDSTWCNQEVGWALARRTPKFVIRMGADPTGFLGSDQWPSGDDLSAKEVASKIGTWAASIPEFGEMMVDGLFSALVAAGNYMDAGATADRIATLSGLTSIQWARLDRIYWQNDQIHYGVLPTRALRPFYQRHGHPWPPLKPSPPFTPDSV